MVKVVSTPYPSKTQSAMRSAKCVRTIASPHPDLEEALINFVAKGTC